MVAKRRRKIIHVVPSRTFASGTSGVARLSYDPDGLTRLYYQHYVDQRGGALDVFHGGEHQYGSGLGSILKAIGRFFLPVAAQSARKFAISAAEGLNAGDSFETAAKKALVPTIHEAVSTSVGTAYKRKAAQKGKGLPPTKRRRLARAPAQRKRTPAKRVYKGRTRTRKVQRKTTNNNNKIRYLNTNF